MYASRVFALALAAIALVACSKAPDKLADAPAPPPPTAMVDGARIIAADNNAEWLSYGRTYSEQRFSPLTKINHDNVKQLGLAWYYQFDANADRGMEATPLIADGVIYTSTSWSHVYALDAKTGQLKWSYDPKVDGQVARVACCDVVNRGVALWNGKVYVGALDGRLIALDAGTGKEVWSTQTTDPALPYTSTGAPRVIKGKVLIGNAGSELGVRGFVSAYDAETGVLAWRFYVTPNPQGKPDEAASDKILAEKATSTWFGDGWRKTGGGGTPWDAITYDPVTDLVYIGTDNGSPWSHQARSNGKGDNLFLSSILALKPDTGEYVWHYQTNPGESWDYSAVQQIMTADLTIKGQKRHVVMQAPKNGFFYVLDAATGKVISAEKYAAVNWAEKIDLATGRPVANASTRYAGAKTTRLSVGPNGAHIWQPMAYNPQTGLVYIPAHRGAFSYQNDPDWQFVAGRWNLAQGPNGGFTQPSSPPPPDKLSPAGEAVIAKLPGEGGFLVAWDPVAQKSRWVIPQGTQWNGGVLATAGDLVFGGTDMTFNAYDAKTGETLWTDKTANAVMAGPATYEIDGEQYVAVNVGYGGANAVIGGRFPRRPGRLYVYKIGGTVKAPEFPAFVPSPPLDLTKLTASTGNAAHGGQLMGQWCMSCHIGGIFMPDLSRSPRISTQELFRDVVHNGALRSRGMANFSQWLSEQDVEDIRAALLDQAKAQQATKK
ncbi:MAG: PQQ-dependent dehydrogenase, methanol/ethanol family [Pseudomonadota bacterium]